MNELTVAVDAVGALRVSESGALTGDVTAMRTKTAVCNSKHKQEQNGS
jgi:hypothetical protein